MDTNGTARAAASALFVRRWAVPVLAELERAGGGAKLVWLVSRTGAGRTAVKQSLGHLGRLGLVTPNPGHGHPMRPEYILTGRGRVVAPPATGLVRALDRLDAMDLGLRKWSMPALASVGAGAERFSEIVGDLRGATDRAVSLALTDLESAGLVLRRVVDDRPPRPVYSVLSASRPCLDALDDLLPAFEDPAGAS